MKLVVFGQVLSSSWDHGHASHWRALCRALARRGHDVVFFERASPTAATLQDFRRPRRCDLVLYTAWEAVRQQAERHCDEADAALVASDCPDAGAAANLVLASAANVRAFYNLGSPAAAVPQRDAEEPAFPFPLEEFDLVLSFGGGQTLQKLRARLGARRVQPLEGCVDPQAFRPRTPQFRYFCDLSYLGTSSRDRQPALNALFFEPARRLDDRRFLIAYGRADESTAWQDNICWLRSVPHTALSQVYSSSRLTLHVTPERAGSPGAAPSPWLLEAAACGTALLSNHWEGLDQVFERRREILVAESAADVIAAIELTDWELMAIGHAARERTLSEYTADHRAGELESLLAGATSPAGNGIALMASH